MTIIIIITFMRAGFQGKESIIDRYPCWQPKFHKIHIIASRSGCHYVASNERTRSNIVTKVALSPIICACLPIGVFSITKVYIYK